MILPLLATLASTVVSPQGADGSTFDRALHRAPAASRVVTVLAGRYPKQTLNAGGRPTIFVPKGRVTVDGVELDGASRVEFRNMTMEGWKVTSGSRITFRRVTTHGAFYIYAPSSYVSVIGGSVGPSHNYNSYIAVPSDDVSRPSRHILVDGVRFHDVSRDPGVHVECLMLADGDDVVIRNSTFTRCSVFDLFVTWWYFRPKVGPPTHVTLARNRLDHTVDGYYSLLFADYVTRGGLPWSDFVLSGNHCGQGWTLGGAARQRFVVRSNPGC